METKSTFTITDKTDPDKRVIFSNEHTTAIDSIRVEWWVKDVKISQIELKAEMWMTALLNIVNAGQITKNIDPMKERLNDDTPPRP